MSDKPKRGTRLIVDGQEVNAEELREMLSNAGMPHTQIVIPKQKSGGVGCGCIGIGLAALGGGIGLLVGILAIIAPNILSGLMGGIFGFSVPQTRPVMGDAANFDFSAAWGDIQAFAGADARLLEFRAQGIRSDGTLDLTANYTPRVDLKFAREVPRPADAPPLGAGGGPGPYYEPIEIEIYKPGTRRSVSSTSNGVRTTYQYVNDGMVRRTSTVTTSLGGTFIPAPECTFAELWQTALRQGAPAEAVAVIEYDERGYTFRIKDINFVRNFDTGCRVVR